MSKIELPAVTGSNNTSRINDNFQKIEDALNQEVLYRKVYAGEPNEMETTLDMNSNRILNLPDATSPTEPVTLGQLEAIDSGDALALRNELASAGGIGLIGACTSIAQLRSVEPTNGGQRIDVSSYYSDWSVIVGGEPKYGGRFWYDSADSTTPDDGFKCIVTAGGKRWKRIKGLYSVGHAGAIEDVSFDSTLQIQSAVNGTKSGEELGFYGGPYNFDKVNLTKPITLVGDADIKHNGFRIKASRITSRLSGLQTCRNYQSSSRAFQALAYTDGSDYEDIKLLFNRFDGFFYSSDMRGREYEAAPSDPSNRVLKNTLIMGCTSTAPSGVPAGHFQHCGVTNAKVSNCSTYGGINATSYNFINGNGYIVVEGCYDQDSTYGSLEIENNRVSYAVVSSCVFGKQLWIDDTSNVSIVGCVVADRVLITAQSNDTDNITISGVTCTRLSVSEFGVGPVGRHKSVLATGCTFTGSTGSNDVFADGSVDSLTIESCQMNGADSAAIAVIRSSACTYVIKNNQSRVARSLSISGTGGRVIEYGNDNMAVSGLSDSKHISNMMLPSSSYLDLPGKYLHGTKYTGSISPGGTAPLSLSIPDSGTLAFRGVSLWVLIRDTATNNISSYRIDGTYRVVGAVVALSFATAYSTLGVDFSAVTVANNTSTSNSINILLTNTSGTKTLQVTVMPEVSSRLGTEE